MAVNSSGSDHQKGKRGARLKITLKRTALVGVAAMMGLFGCSNSQSPLFELPPRFLSSGMLCSSNSAFIFGGEGGVFERNNPMLFKSEAKVFKVSGDGFDEVLIGPGRALDASEPELGTIYVVRTIEESPGSELAYLDRSNDGGSTWETIESAPANLVGVLFDSRDEGFAWSRSIIYHTMDGGGSWSQVIVPSEMPRGSASAEKPVLASDGALWVAAGHGLSWNPDRNFLARVGPDMSLDIRLRNVETQILEIDVSDDGVVWLLANSGSGRGALDLLTLEDAQETLTKAGEVAGAQAEYLVVRESEIFALVATAGSSPKWTLSVSRDRGSSWEVVGTPERLINEACSGHQGGIWIVGSSGAVYPPS